MGKPEQVKHTPLSETIRFSKTTKAYIICYKASKEEFYQDPSKWLWSLSKNIRSQKWQYLFFKFITKKYMIYTIRTVQIHYKSGNRRPERYQFQDWSTYRSEKYRKPSSIWWLDSRTERLGQPMLMLKALDHIQCSKSIFKRISKFRLWGSWT